MAIAAVMLGVAQAVGPAQGQAPYRQLYLLATRTLAWFALLYLVAGTLLWLSRLVSLRRTGEGREEAATERSA